MGFWMGTTLNYPWVYEPSNDAVRIQLELCRVSDEQKTFRKNKSNQDL